MDLTRLEDKPCDVCKGRHNVWVFTYKHNKTGKMGTTMRCSEHTKEPIRFELEEEEAPQHVLQDALQQLLDTVKRA